MRFSWIRARGAVVVSAAVMALQGAPVLAQFVPYTPNANQSYNQYQAHTARQPQDYQAQPQYGQPQFAQPQYGQPQFGQAQYTQPQYTAMAFQGSSSHSGVPSLSQPIESVGPGQMMQSAPTQSVPMQSYSAAPSAGCNCQSSPAMNYSQSAPGVSYESYPSSGCTDNSCGTYNTFNGGCGVSGMYGRCGAGCDAGCGGGCDGGCGGGYLGSGLGRRGCGRQWFGGMYGLYMERVGNAWRPLAFSTTDGQPVGYYPAANEYVMNLTDLDQDTFAGAEFRFGSTFGSNPCGCGPRLGWEVAYWGLLEENQTASYTDTVGNRLYTMVDYRGLEYDPDGAGPDGYRPVNHYFDYGPPTSDYTVGGLDEIQVRTITARQSFSFQNIEANILRMPVLSGGCASGCCSSGCGSRYSVTTLAGFRYMRIDDDFMIRSDYDNVTDATSGFMRHNVDVDSHLAGAQLGCNVTYNCGKCGRWGLHCNTAVGIFNNHSEVWNRLDSPTDTVQYANNGNDSFDLRYEDDNISMLGELRAGASYQYSCNWRLFGGYRLLGLTGMALSQDQLVQPAYISAAQTSYVDADGSIFMHGLQAGIECTY